MPIINRIAEFGAELTAWRQDLHAHPELAFEEVRTAGIVAQRLREFGFDEVHTGIARTGVVGVLHGARGPKLGEGGRAIGLRADMDALPMQETNDFAHRSTVPGKMHACGHDGHTAMLLGAARYLAETRNFAGTVHVIFQPAEEGAGGGELMVREGLFDRFPCDRVFGMHNWPELPEGHIAVRAGPMMAAVDDFDITVGGVGGHGAMPHLCLDPVPVAAQIVLAAQTLVSRATDPFDAGVVSITRVEAGSAYNIVPAAVRLSGTIRSLRPEVRKGLAEGLRRIAETVPAAFGATGRFDFHPGYPATVNSAAEAELAARVAAEVVGPANVGEAKPSMGAEDFAYMLNARPGAYLFLGQAGAAGGCMVHNPGYDFNDAILPVGASFWARLVETALPAPPR